MECSALKDHQQQMKHNMAVLLQVGKERAKERKNTSATAAASSELEGVANFVKVSKGGTDGTEEDEEEEDHAGGGETTSFRTTTAAARIL